MPVAIKHSHLKYKSGDEYIGIDMVSDRTTSQQVSVINAAAAAKIADIRSYVNRAATIYCWGDSLTEGVGGYIMPPDGANAYMAYSYPAWLSQTYNVVNLGARSEDLNSIMARQGADPIVLSSAITIPASKDTPVLVQQVIGMYNLDAGSGFVSKHGAVVKINKQVESPGLNPCVIGGVEGMLYREIGSSHLDDVSTYNYYFKRLEDGDETTVAAGSIITTYAMRYYRGGGIAVIWAGANGGWQSVLDYINKVRSMIQYGEYENYLIIISREFTGSNLETIKEEFTDEDGFCHVISLMEILPYRGYAMAGIGRNGIDTSGWTTTDPVKLNAPLLCEYLSGQTGENLYGATHYSIWGYKAIGKLVAEKLGTMILNVKKDTTNYDEYGVLLYKLTAPVVLDGTGYLNTHVNLYDDRTKNWTMAIKWSGTPTSTGAGGYPVNIFCDTTDSTWKGILYRYTGAGAAALILGTSNNAVGQNDLVDNYGETSVVIIAKSGDNYTVLCNNTTKYTKTSAITDEQEHNLPLIIGARYNKQATQINYESAFNLDDLRVYNDALSESNMIALYNELAGT